MFEKIFKPKVREMTFRFNLDKVTLDDLCMIEAFADKKTAPASISPQKLREFLERTVTGPRPIGSLMPDEITALLWEMGQALQRAELDQKPSDTGG